LIVKGVFGVVLESAQFTKTVAFLLLSTFTIALDELFEPNVTSFELASKTTYCFFDESNPILLKSKVKLSEVPTVTLVLL